MVFSEEEVAADIRECCGEAENYGYWLAIKHVVLGLIGVMAAYVTWHIPV